jgi:hypothetical protein
MVCIHVVAVELGHILGDVAHVDKAGDKMTAYYIDRMENVSATATVATVPTPPQT